MQTLLGSILNESQYMVVVVQGESLEMGLPYTINKSC